MGVPAEVAALTEGVVKAMFVTRIKAALSVVLTLALLATGATLLTGRMAAGLDEQKSAAEKLVGAKAKQPKEKDKEPFTAWGQEIGGLQAGLGLKAGTRRVYHHGETVELVVRVRNVGKEEVTFQYLRHFFIENPPIVVDDKGKPVALKDGTPRGIYKPLDVTLAPRKEVNLYELNLALGEKSTDTPGDSTLYGEGTFRLQYGRVLGESSLSSVAIKCDPALRKLATGKLDIVVEDPKKAEAKQAPAPHEQPAKTDRERMVGNWFIMNEDSGRKGEMWVITEDSILMGANDQLLNFLRLDAGTSPKQIDITIMAQPDGQPVAIIKGIYVLDGDELRLCLASVGKDRPTAFPEKPKPGEVLVLQRATAGASPPKAKDGQPEQKVLTPEEVIRQRPKEKVTVEFKVTAVQDMSTMPGTGFGQNYILLKHDGRFGVRLVPPAMNMVNRLGIEPVKHFSGKVIRATGRFQPALAGENAKGPFWIEVDDLNQFFVVPQ